MDIDKATGRLGERIAGIYLKKKGYKIISRNFRNSWGEIDLISRSPNGILEFIEVKSSSSDTLTSLAPEDHMTYEKIKRLKRICDFFSNRFKSLSENGWQIDFVSVRIPKEKIIFLSRLSDILLTRFIKCCDISFIENI